MGSPAAALLAVLHLEPGNTTAYGYILLVFLVSKTYILLNGLQVVLVNLLLQCIEVKVVICTTIKHIEIYRGTYTFKVFNNITGPDDLAVSFN